MLICAERAGRDRSQVYRRRNVDHRFAEEMDRALETSERLLAELVTRRRIA